jgi:hypothetical protein
MSTDVDDVDDALAAPDDRAADLQLLEEVTAIARDQLIPLIPSGHYAGGLVDVLAWAVDEIKRARGEAKREEDEWADLPGYDYMELGVRFGLVTREAYRASDYDEDTLLSDIQYYLSDPRYGPEAARGMRAYLQQLIRHGNTYATPVWRGLLEVEDDATFLRLCGPLIPYMWD